ncbi:MAG: VOC family protein [Chloroflexi bacterium]|nr:VOC family protein [Chloroflexota bacterium]
MIERFFGLNIAVKDLDEAVRRYSAVFGPATPMDPRQFAFPGLKGATIKIGDVDINLIASDQPGTAIADFVEKRGEGVFLVSAQVDDAAETIQQLKTQGVRFTTEEPLVYGVNKEGRVAFSHPRSLNGVVWEFIQPKA